MNRREFLNAAIGMSVVNWTCQPCAQGGQELAGESQPTEASPLRFMLHGGMSHELPGEEYLHFVERVKPQVLVTGVFDQRLYAAAVPAPMSGGKAASPLQPQEHLARWKKIIDRLHRSDIKVIGQMELFVVSDRPEELTNRTGWFGYYDAKWNEDLLGVRPTKTAAEWLEETGRHEHPGPAKQPGSEADVMAACGCRVNLKALRGCANKPVWRGVQKRLVQAAVEIGVDGFITNRNYFGHCTCEHCLGKFRQWLAEHFRAEELKDRFGIDDLAKQDLQCVVGAHRDHETVPSPFVLEKQRFAKHMAKECFDDVYVRYGRSLRPGLFVAQWNHMAYFDELHLDRGHLPPATRTTFAHASADERWGLLANLWGRDESLLWYCNWGTTQNTMLAKEYAGDTVLYGKYLRAMAAGKPYVINKYDFYRPRNMMAEAAALGYVTNAIATPWQIEEDQAVVARYFDFLKRNEAYYQRAESFAEVAVVFPQQALHAGDASALEYVEAAGRTLVRGHVLFDILPDDGLARASLGRYRVVVLATPEYLDEKGRTALEEYTKRGGKLILAPVTDEDRERPGAVGEAARRMVKAVPPLAVNALTVKTIRTNRDGFLKALDDAVGGADRLSRFEAPWTVQVHAYHQPKAQRLMLHLVNYHHDEKAAGKSVAAREAPTMAEPVAVHLKLPKDFRAKSVTFLSPDDERKHLLDSSQQDDTLNFKTPAFLVYGLSVVEG